MKEILFVIKSIVIALILIIIFQIKVGSTTLEQKTFHWIKNSSTTEPIREAAQGAFQLFNDFIGKPFSQATKDVSFHLDKKAEPLKEKAKQNARLQWTRSKAYLREQAKKEVEEELKQEQEKALKRLSQ
jgi:hypothetical protein